MNSYKISFFKKVKFGEPYTRSVMVTPSIKRGSKEEGAKAALGVFMSSVGNLKEYEVVSIQEMDAAGNPIGEPIVPA